MDNFIILSENKLQDMLNQAAAIGANAGIENFKNHVKDHNSTQTDRRLHNTKLLLKNYRGLKDYAKNAVFNRTRIGSETVFNILNDMMQGRDDDITINSIKNTAARTVIMIDHIDKMLSMYKFSCEHSGNDLDLRRYDVIYSLYIADNKQNCKDLADKWCISLKCIYDDEKIAINQLSTLLYGIDALQLQ